IHPKSAIGTLPPYPRFVIPSGLGRQSSIDDVVGGTHLGDRWRRIATRYGSPQSPRGCNQVRQRGTGHPFSVEPVFRIPLFNFWIARFKRITVIIEARRRLQHESPPNLCADPCKIKMLAAAERIDGLFIAAYAPVVVVIGNIVLAELPLHTGIDTPPYRVGIPVGVVNIGAKPEVTLVAQLIISDKGIAEVGMHTENAGHMPEFGGDLYVMDQPADQRFITDACPLVRCARGSGGSWPGQARVVGKLTSRKSARGIVIDVGI